MPTLAIPASLPDETTTGPLSCAKEIYIKDMTRTHLPPMGICLAPGLRSDLAVNGETRVAPAEDLPHSKGTACGQSNTPDCRNRDTSQQHLG